MLKAATTSFTVLCNSGLVAYCIAVSNIFFSFCLSGRVSAAEPTFLGQNSCSSSSCHGGAGANQNQNIVWSRQDPHSKAPATLTTARSATLARVLGIKDATQDRRCTSCHSPWQGVSAQVIPPHLNASVEAVSCESCHGPASEYLRSHTRPDLNRAQKATDGLRDLTVLYNRANACVACHQAIDPALLQAGHPELIFELDGQTTAMPRHWRERDPAIRPKALLAGQAAGLREVTAQLRQQKASGEVSAKTFEQWQALLWIVSKTVSDQEAVHFTTNAVASAEDLGRLHSASDRLALRISSLSDTNFASGLLTSLAKTSGDFAESKATAQHLAHRADRLVLALDRLAMASSPETRARVENDLNQLFRLVQNRTAFDPTSFAAQLRSFEASLARRP